MRFINQFEIDIQKLLITLSTGSIVLSISFLKIFPLTKISTTYCLIWSWIFFGVSITIGIISLIAKSWWFGNKLMEDNSKGEKYQKNRHKKITNIWKITGIACARIQEILFIIAIILLLKFSITSVMAS